MTFDRLRRGPKAPLVRSESDSYASYGGRLRLTLLLAKDQGKRANGRLRRACV